MSDGIECRIGAFANVICDRPAASVPVRSEVEMRLILGMLPRTLEEWPAGWVTRACEPTLLTDWAGWCRMWRKIAYVRMQAFDRDAEAEFASEGME